MPEGLWRPVDSFSGIRTHSPPAIPVSIHMIRLPRPQLWWALAVVVALGSAGVLWAADEDYDGDAVEQAVIEIDVTSQRADWYSPWQDQRLFQASGSGFLIGPHRLMTNAHVVSDAKQIVVRRSAQSQVYFAEVEYIAHDSDLAILHVKDVNFDKGITPLSIGDLPTLRSRVRTYGFPAGGDRISRTEGVVSRIQFITYLHSGVYNHLAVQTDSAINPGNSGGPVLQDGKVVGVAFQTNTRLQGVGFFIPAPVIKRFLTDIGDGHYDGYAELGVSTSNLLNPMYRDYLGMPAGMQGVVVDRVLPHSSAEGIVQPSDVLLAVDQYSITLDGNIDYFGHNLNFDQVAEQKQIGEPMKLTVWRQGKKTDLTVTLKGLPDADRIRNRFNVSPSYLIYGGLVFMPLDQEYLNTFGNYWQSADKPLLYAQFYRPVEEPTVPQSSVLLTRVLPSSLNRGYRNLANSLVSTVNGQKVYTLTDLDKALAASKGPYVQIILQTGNIEVVLDREAARKAQPEILSAYGILKDRRLP
jgi:S1-C subfamily serine protease